MRRVGPCPRLARLGATPISTGGRPNSYRWPAEIAHRLPEIPQPGSSPAAVCTSFPSPSTRVWTLRSRGSSRGTRQRGLPNSYRWPAEFQPVAGRKCTSAARVSPARQQPRRGVHVLPLAEYGGLEASVRRLAPQNALGRLAKFQSLIPAKFACKGVSPATTLFSVIVVQTFQRLSQLSVGLRQLFTRNKQSPNSRSATGSFSQEINKVPTHGRPPAAFLKK